MGLHLHEMRDTDTHFIIDPVTRAISNTQTTKKLMQYDHNSEIFTFEIPRYVDNHDMQTCEKIEVHYINIDAKTKDQSKDVYLVTDAALEADTLVFSWLVSGNATKYAGSLNFLIRFSCLDEAGNVVYRWNTDIFKTLSVSDGFSNTESVVADFSDTLEQWKIELENAGGAGSAGKAWIVNVTDSGEDAYISDKSFSQIAEAIAAGKEPVCVFGAFHYQLISNNPSKIVFYNSECDAVIAYRTLTFDNSNGGTDITFKHEMPRYQFEVDSRLETSDTTIVGAINEVNKNVNDVINNGTGGSGATAEQLAQIAQNTDDIAELRAAIDIQYNALVNTASSAADVDTLFKSWWNINWKEGETTRNELISRWFENVLYDDRVHGVKMPLFATSNTAIGEFTDDSVGLTCVPSTAAAAGQDDFAKLPQFWCLEVSMERFEDGHHEIYKVQHIDPIEEVRSGEYGLCQVLQKNTYTAEWDEDGYRYFKMARTPQDDGHEWYTWPQGTDRNGNVYPYIANPKYAAGLLNGIPTSGTGLAPMNYMSHNSGVQWWNKRGSQYSGASGNLLKWQLAMIWLKYARKGNSGTIEGCTSFSCRYSAAVGESAVERIIITTAQAANLLVGCNVHIGTSSEGYQIARDVTVTAIETVTINESEYAAVYVDNGGTTFDTTAGGTYISTMPWKSGRNDNVLGYDGSCTNYTNGKEPGLIQKTEFQNGAYLILSDELCQCGKDADGNYTFDCYTCHNQSNVTTNGMISSDYEKQDDLTLVFSADDADGWKYGEDTAISKDRGVLWIVASTAAGSGTGVKAGFHLSKSASGVRAAWCCCDLTDRGHSGLPARHSSLGAPDSNWRGCVGAPSGVSG